jgi:hypothetical protein
LGTAEQQQPDQPPIGGREEIPEAQVAALTHGLAPVRGGTTIWPHTTAGSIDPEHSGQQVTGTGERP